MSRRTVTIRHPWAPPPGVRFDTEVFPQRSTERFAWDADKRPWGFKVYKVTDTTRRQEATGGAAFRWLARYRAWAGTVAAGRKLVVAHAADQRIARYKAEKGET